MFQVEIWKVSLKNGFKNASPVTWPIYLVQMWNLSQISCIIMSRNHMFRSSATRFSFSFDASSLSSWLALQLLTQRIFLAFMLFHDVVGFQVTVVFWSNCATSACLSHDRRRRPCFDRHVKARPEKNIFRRKFWVRIDKLDKPDGGLVKFLLAEARSKSCRCRGPGCLSSSASSGIGSTAPTRCLLKKIVSTEPNFETDLRSAITRVLTCGMRTFYGLAFRWVASEEIKVCRM